MFPNLYSRRWNHREHQNKYRARKAIIKRRDAAAAGGLSWRKTSDDNHRARHKGAIYAYALLAEAFFIDDKLQML